ncbi:sulfite exporter TauE/SafE family protein [Palleronia sp.]|uniref:sulfite exporter TauE/SafE family protein n=1 Tax=Palleronia sp. TaxID=1940284 RepID=UPI0035C86E06
MLLDLLPPDLLVFAFILTCLAGFVKGAVGFAMPLIMISTLSILIDPRLVVAGIVLPIVMSNALQVARAGWTEARAALVEFWRYIFVVCVMIVVAAQFLTVVPVRVIYAALGVPVAVLSVVQLIGWRFSITPERRGLADLGIGVVAGGLGGFAGVWGPPTVLYLLALDTPKHRQLAVQGVVYGLGSVALLAGHLRSGILNGETVWFSLFLLVPAALGMWIGWRAGDRLDQGKFRRATLVVLIVAGLNLIRRGITG